MLRRADGRRGHIFNLGHGVLPQTDPDVLTRLTRARPGARGMSDVAVVLMAYGSPDRLEDVPAYYADIRGGRPIRPELLENLVERYRRLGIEDANPLNAITEETRAALERELGAAGLHRHEALAAADRRRGRGGARDGRHDRRRSRPRPALLARLDRRLPRAARGGARRTAPSSSSSRAGTTIPASSHCSPTAFEARTRTSSSRPIRCPRASSKAATRTRSSCSRPRGSWPRRPAVADWSFSYQSESATGEPWLQPDILDHLAALRAKGVDAVLVCPVGFVSDHLEIRWDLDVEAAERASELGLRYERIEMPNADPAFIRVLAGIVRRAAALPSSA